MIVNEKITVKEISIDKYEKFKEKYWYKVLEIMRKYLDNLVYKVIRKWITRWTIVCNGKNKH
ncbi:hypothetical protein [Clostridium sartagoforme]|uniref:hypothetical protein n=1 Tax=Clostridium sartagoforme TaxID=84031 RepID=UPI0031E26A9A